MDEDYYEDESNQNFEYDSVLQFSHFLDGGGQDNECNYEGEYLEEYSNNDEFQATATTQKRRPRGRPSLTLGSSKKETKTEFSPSKRYFKCSTCNYVTSVKARYTKHVKYHSMPLIKCEFCDFKTPYKWNLDRHYKNHNGEGTLSCPLCNFRAEIKQSLTVHIQNHHSHHLDPSKPEDMEKQEDMEFENEHEQIEYNNVTITPFTGNGTGNIKQEPKSIVSKSRHYQEITTSSSSDGKNSSDFIHPDDILDKNGKIYIKKLKCKYCNYKAVWETEMNRHLSRNHGIMLSKRRNSFPSSSVTLSTTSTSSSNTTITLTSTNTVNAAKPLPSLIPIINQKPNSSVNSNSSNNYDDIELTRSNSPISTSSVKTEQRLSTDKEKSPLAEDDDDDEFIGGDEVPEAETEEKSETPTPPNAKSQFLESLSLKPNVVYSNSAHENEEDDDDGERKEGSPNLKIIDFDDKLDKNIEENFRLDRNKMLQNNLTITSNNGSTSILTKCQYCHHRCKSTSDLAIHISLCSYARNKEYAKSDLDEENTDEGHQSMSSQDFPIGTFQGKDGTLEITHWGESDDGLIGYETSPGIGVTSKDDGNMSENVDFSLESLNENKETDSTAITTTRKVYRCPHANCGFWAATASRFHVHAVGHLNVKPFECNICQYRSNWRWDISKHIRLKSLRDTEHHNATILLKNPTGEKNYRQYDKYLTMMQLTHSALDTKLPDCSTVANKRYDVELNVNTTSSNSRSSTPKISPSGSSNGNGGKLRMPKLTRAPTTEIQISSLDSLTTTPIPEEKLSTIAPPSLKLISGKERVYVDQNQLSGGHVLTIEEDKNKKSVKHQLDNKTSAGGGPPQKKSKPGDKKVQWKCKKCEFRHSSKELVVFHIREHHKPKRGESVSILKGNNMTSVSPNVQSQDTESLDSQKTVKAETHQYIYNEKERKYSCKFCPFTTIAINVMDAHSENHFSKPNCDFSCDYCSYSVSNKIELAEHLQLHGIDAFEGEKEKGRTRKIDPTINITKEETPPKPKNYAATSSSPYKKYHCLECPYLTDSKGQFLYHKQFHRPNTNSAFKCSYCNYNVSHKHLLHQHLRVHGISSSLPSSITNSQSSDCGSVDSRRSTISEEMNFMIAEQRQINQISSQSSNNSTATDIEIPVHPAPSKVIWQNGRPFRIYQCRMCPLSFHSSRSTNGRDSGLNDLIEHELTHGIASASFKLPSQVQQQHQIKSPNKIGNGNSQESRKSPGGGGNSQGQTKPYLYMCDDCPARFPFDKEYQIHKTFHFKDYPYRCNMCSYSARQNNPHLLSHMKVHSPEYQLKTQYLLQSMIAAPPSAYSHNNVSSSSKTLVSSEAVKQNLAKLKIESTKMQSPPISNTKIISCGKCPAKFSSIADFQTHLSLHKAGIGLGHGHLKCRFCSFVVDSKQALYVHEKEHTDAFEERAKLHCQDETNLTLARLITDEDEGLSGNPAFIYPTYIKNGKIKTKRYRCNRCPSAFDKRDQYKVHIGLHGSNQRYKCSVPNCDYAVTYYANFIQHLKKHTNQKNITPDMLVAKPLSKCKNDSSNLGNQNTNNLKPFEEEKKGGLLFKCFKCPFKTYDRKNYESHMLHHNLRTRSGKLRCSFCDFGVNEKDSLKAHIKLHFKTSEAFPEDQPETYMLAEDIEILIGNDEKIYSEKENYDSKDTGLKMKTEDEERKEQINKVYVDMMTGLPNLPIFNEEEPEEGESKSKEVVAVATTNNEAS